MENDLNVRFRDDYIHVVHGESFEISPDTMAREWAAIADACREHDCYRVLVEGKAPRRRMSTSDAFESGERASSISPKLAVALCFYDYEPDDLSDFFETVAANRGARVAFFGDQKTALDWLRSDAISSLPEFGSMSEPKANSDRDR